MLTLVEKILFLFAVILSLFYTWKGLKRIIENINSAQGSPDWKIVSQKAAGALAKFFTFQPVFRFRLLPSIFHGLIGWGFIAFLVINLNDLIYAFFDWKLLENLGIFGDLYRFLADFMNIAILLGIAAMAVRRFILRPDTLSTRATTLLDEKARTGITRDSAIVAGFIFLHNTGRLFGDSFSIALSGKADGYQPIISSISRLWAGVPSGTLIFGEHLMFWLSIGAVVAFLPYFPYSKHLHLFFAPINFALKPARTSIGQLNFINLEDETIEQFGAAQVKDLGYEQVLDAYSCIMCFRCQEVCPAYNTGKLLSPAALEINKRYNFNYGGGTDKPLLELISEEAVWACTTCGACVDICPVGNEPMRDILDIRRSLSMMESSFPKQLETAFKGMERNMNPWNVSQADRMKWAQGLNVPTIEQNPEPDILWWVGCAPATDVRAQKTAGAFAGLLSAAGVNYAVLGKNESCTGDSARRAGREDIFFGLAQGNVELLNEVKPKRMVTTCPHCLHTIKNEYPAFGGNYEIIHHTQLINELIGAGRLQLKDNLENNSVTYHDPCYLSRHNQVIDDPRKTLQLSGLNNVEMTKNSSNSFCCGAGGSQMWKEEEPGSERINNARFLQAKDTGAASIAVACPFCLSMITDASKADTGMIEVQDIAEIVFSRLKN